MSDKESLNLLGKEYLTVTEAAHYAGVSVSQFNSKKLDYGIFPITFMGKVLYRRDDIKNAIESHV